MPSDDYAPVVRGGLKLKGGAKPSGVSKKKKKKDKTARDLSPNDPKRTALEKAALEGGDVVEGRSDSKRAGVPGEETGEEAGEDGETGQLRELEERDGDGKTASERALEETRRKRLLERFQKQGAKTHKERVEELNKYLSNLSEHHDMPRIGPG